MNSLFPNSCYDYLWHHKDAQKKIPEVQTNEATNKGIIHEPIQDPKSKSIDNKK